MSDVSDQNTSGTTSKTQADSPASGVAKKNPQSYAAKNNRFAQLAAGVSGAALAVTVIGGAVYASGYGRHDDSQLATMDQRTDESAVTKTVTETPDSGADHQWSQDGRNSAHGGKDAPGRDHHDSTTDTESRGSASGSGSSSSATPERGSAHQLYNHKGVYLIKPGDTLSSISAAVGVSVDALMHANQIINPNLIYANSALRIP